MAFSETITDWIANYTSDGTDITIPIASIPELTAAEAHTSTGDIRKFIFAFADMLADAWYVTATADRPTTMRISRGIDIDPTTKAESTRFSFTFTTEVGVGGREVADEPVE